MNRAKGFYGTSHKRLRGAIEAVKRAQNFEFRGRKQRKRDLRSLWIARLSAAVRALGLSYSRFIKGLKTAKVEVNRKMLSELSINEPGAFKKVVELAKQNS
jgi:large subunit ribosomal protein L20